MPQRRSTTARPVAFTRPPGASWAHSPQVAAESGVQRSVRVEGEALQIAALAALVGIAVGMVLFAGESTPLWLELGLGSSIGLDATLTVGAVGVAVSVVSYWRSAYLPGQRWRAELATWRHLIDGTAVSVVHAGLAMLATGTAFFVLQNAFRMLTLGTYVATFAVAFATALGAYILYVSIARLTTVLLWQRLTTFMMGGVILSMATSSDPTWWRLHFSHLGAIGGWPSVIFNVTIVVAGALVVTFSLYIRHDIHALLRAKKVGRAWSAPVMSSLFAAMGICLAGIGLIPTDFNTDVHNIIAGSTALLFAVLMLLSLCALTRLPWSLHAATVAAMAILAVDVWLWLDTTTFNLTSFELLAFVTLFGWVAIFVRSMAAVLGTHPILEVAQHETDATRPTTADVP